MPLSSDADQMILSGLLTSWAQFFNRVAGTPSGPGAESLSNSDIALTMSLELIDIKSSDKGFLITGRSNVGSLISGDDGSLYTEAN